MNSKIVCLTVAFLIGILSYAQQISNVNFDDVQAKVQDASSEYYYPTLQQRIAKLDTSLTQEHYYYLYYGFVFQERYNPYGKTEAETKFYDLVEKKKYEKAIPLAYKSLAENPVDIDMYYVLLYCYYSTQNREEAVKIASIYFALLDVLNKSGDGKSEATAYVVIRVADEYALTKSMELTVVRQALLGGNTDVLSFDTKSQKGDNVIEELYFNIEKPFDALARMMKGK